MRAHGLRRGAVQSSTSLLQIVRKLDLAQAWTATRWPP